jgi:hypothetical protein
LLLKSLFKELGPNSFGECKVIRHSAPHLCRAMRRGGSR